MAHNSPSAQPFNCAGLTVEEVIPPTSPHKFTWYNGDPADYRQLLEGRKILSASGFGAFVELEMENGAHLLVSDGVNMRHYAQGEELPVKHQLAITLNDGSSLIFTVAMYGGIYAHSGSFDRTRTTLAHAPNSSRWTRLSGVITSFRWHVNRKETCR